jgi:Flp pilus assembly protein TadG
MLRIAGFCKDDRGASLVEMTLVTPFLIFLGLGISEFGNTLYHQHLITTGLHDASRYLARFDDPLAAVALAGAKDIAVTGSIGGTDKRVSWWNTSDITVTIQNFANPIDSTTGLRPYRGTDPLKVVRVATSVDHPGLGFLSVIGISSPLTINVHHEERVIGE